jgi:hypothetical protein
MLGHPSIVLTAGTSSSALPEVRRRAGEDTAALVIAAGPCHAIQLGSAGSVTVSDGGS